MIKNDFQLKSSEEALRSLNEMLKAPIKEGVPEEVARAAKSHVQEMKKGIEAEIDEYKKLLAVKEFVKSITSLDDLLKIPMLYRVALKMTIDQFARKVETSARQINRYEKEDYQNIGITNFIKIMEKLDLEISGEICVNKKKKRLGTTLEVHA